MSQKKERNPKYVSAKFCDERTRRIEEKIDNMRNDVIIALNKKNELSWQAKATIIGSLLVSLASIAVAYIQVFA